MKNTVVTLATIDGGGTQAFDIEVAENILRMRKSGWELPADSEFKFEDGTISRRDKKNSK
jgi:hypothetical protein